MSKANKDFFKQKNHWSEIKDQLLGCYLMPYFQKVLKTNKPILYVDCFAGKGKFDDGKPGSPITALKICDECLQKSKKQDGRIETYFIELNHATDLTVNIANHKLATIISGRYEEKIEGLLSDKKAYNVFLYIDPYGIKALDFTLFEKFRNFGFSSLEMLINFNSFGFFRDACRVLDVNCESDEALTDLDELVEYEPTHFDTSSKSADLLTRIAGGEYWKDIVRDYQINKDGRKAERSLSAMYKQRLLQQFDYVLDMPIRLKPDKRPKYRMVHACNHIDGWELMAKNMLSRKEYLFLYIQQQGQPWLLDSETSISTTIENELMTDDEIKKLLLEHISSLPKKENRLKMLLASFVNANGLLCDFRIIHNLLKDLDKQGKIKIIRNPEFTEKIRKMSDFMEDTEDKTVTIRRLIP